MKRSGRTTWILQNLGVDDALIGDLIEEQRSGRSRAWFWRQVLTATLHEAGRHAGVIVGTVLVGWVVLWVFFRFVGAPLAQLDSDLLADGLIDRYTAVWWLRSGLMWLVVGCPSSRAAGSSQNWLGGFHYFPS